MTDGVSPPDDAAALEPSERPSRLAILKALGDNTRYAIYLELARSPLPLSTAEIADTLDLHPNTVRPHLERMRDVGLLEVRTASRGEVGRPQHLYSLATGAPSLGLEPPPFPLLARLLLRIAGATGAGADEAIDAGRAQGSSDAAKWSEGVERTSCLHALTAELATLGFDPAVGLDQGSATVAFTHCPFRELAETRPDLVCGLHRGMVEGLVDGVGGGRVAAFRSLVDRSPCQVDLELGPLVDAAG